jgi:hypothetical protein
VAPYDRRAAQELRLPFYEVGVDGRSPPPEETSLQQELASLKFDQIKIRTFRGALWIRSAARRRGWRKFARPATSSPLRWRPSAA